jgi:hypothetical protein
MENEVKIVVKWNGKEYDICNLSDSDSIGTLKNAIHKATGVRPERQKLLNLKLKGIELYDVNLNFRLSAVYIFCMCCYYVQSIRVHVVR